eukprot:6492704-Alexandrium_andersonii.AAC.1
MGVPGFWQGGSIAVRDSVLVAMHACAERAEQAIVELGFVPFDRGKYVMTQFDPLSENCAFLVNGYKGFDELAARMSPFRQFLHYRRFHTAFVHTKLSSIFGASGAQADN